MSSCFAFDCNHQFRREGCSFYRFPKDKKSFKLWRDLCRRDDAEPKRESSRLCSCHFKDKLKSNGPTMFPWTTGRFIFTSPEKRKRKPPVHFTVDDEPVAGSSDVHVDSDLTARCISSSEPMRALSKTPSSTATSLPYSPTKIITNIDITMLTNELALLRSEVALLKAHPSNKEPGNILDYLHIKDNMKLFQYYTGLPNSNVFEMLLKWLDVGNLKYIDNWTVLKLSPENQLLLTLIKLRLNLDLTDLSVRFQIARCGVRNIFLTFLHALHARLFPCLKMPSTRKNKESLPSAFSNFSNCRCIVDCTEIYCSVPRSSLDKQSQTFSFYKHRNTFKGLVACSPHGVITYVSKLYPGSISDKIIFKECGISDLLIPGDLVLADKGFLISDVVPQGVSVNIPPFLKHGRLTQAEAVVTTEIARARINIERVIGRMKNYDILDFVPTHLRKYGTIILQVVACLINLHPPLIRTDSNLDSNCADNVDSDYENLDTDLFP